MTQKLITEEITDLEKESGKFKKKEKNQAAVMLGRLGGLKGGKARASKLSATKRSEIAKKAAETRWHKESQNNQE